MRRKPAKGIGSAQVYWLRLHGVRGTREVVHPFQFRCPSGGCTAPAAKEPSKEIGDLPNLGHRRKMAFVIEMSLGSQAIAFEHLGAERKRGAFLPRTARTALSYRKSEILPGTLDDAPCGWRHPGTYQVRSGH